MIHAVRDALKYSMARGVVMNEFYNLSYVNKHTCVIFLLLSVQISILAPKYENAQNAQVAILARGTSSERRFFSKTLFLRMRVECNLNETTNGSAHRTRQRGGQSPSCFLMAPCRSH